MEIEISHLMQSDLSDFSASIAERGQNAGRDTWNNSKAAAEDRPLVPADMIETARDYFAGFGAWDDDERAAWSHDEVQAMVLQYICGDVREAQRACPGVGPGRINWAQYRKDSEAGRVSGLIYRVGGKVFASLCH